MTDDQIIALAESLGWNIEHAETNKMLILFARDIEDRIRDPLYNISKKNKRPLPYEPDPR
jgi:hypothetical protein